MDLCYNSYQGQQKTDRGNDRCWISAGSATGLFPRQILIPPHWARSRRISVNRFSEEEVTELPNAADVTNIELTLDGERFDLTQGIILGYRRSLNIRTGLLSREVRWRSPAGRVYALCFERVVSLRRLHSIAMKVTVRPEQDTAVKLRSGIDGRMTNDGSQHFSEGQTRSYDDKTVLQFTPRTVQSNIHFVISTVHRFTLDGEAVDPARSLSIVRRRMVTGFTQTLTAGQTLVMEKFATVFTTRDRDKNEIVEESYVTIYQRESKKTVVYKPLWIHQDKNDINEVGQTIHITMETYLKNAYVLCEVISNDKLLESKWVRLDRGKNTYTYKLSERDLGNVVFRAYAVQNNFQYTEQLNIHVPYSHKDIDFDFITFRDKTEPGSAEQYQIRLKDKNGDKVAAELLCGMYDASLDAFASPNSFKRYIFQ